MTAVNLPGCDEWKTRSRKSEVAFATLAGVAVALRDENRPVAAKYIEDAAADLRAILAGSERPEPKPATAHASTSPGPVNCTQVLRAQGKTYPRTCGRCGLGPCPFFDKEGNAK